MARPTNGVVKTLIRAVRDWVNRTRKAPRAICAILLAVGCVAACAEAPDGVQPEPPRPVAISVSPDSATLGFIGETATFTATVTDQHGAAFPGTVTWRSLQPTVFTVSSNGMATAVSNGSGALSASLEGLSATARVTVRQVPATAAEAAGGGQEALPGSTLRDPIVVRVLDQGGTPTAGATIHFEPSEGHGSATPDSDTTDAAGEASTLWTLGTSIGPKLLTARVPDGPSVRITATATVGSAVEIVAGDQQSALVGTPLRDPIVVRVLDRHGEPFPGTAVRFRLLGGNGSVTPDSVVTDGAGEAAALWTLGDSAGPQFLNAAVPSGPATRVEARGLTGVGICDRTVQVRRSILEATGQDDCADVTDQELARIRSLGIGYALPLSGISRLYDDDFRGLSGLEVLALQYNDFASLPSRVFSDLSSLRVLALRGNRALSELPEDLFSGLSSLEALSLDGNRFTELPSGMFTGLHNLRGLDLSWNRLETLPAGVFSSLSRLGRLQIGENPIRGLPDGIFANLQGLKVLHVISRCDTDASAARFTETMFQDRDPSAISVGSRRDRDAFLLPAQSGRWRAEAAVSGQVDDLLRPSPANAAQRCVDRSTSLSAGTLSGLVSLDTLSIGGWFDEVRSGAFSNLSSLKYLKLESPVVHLADGALADLASLESLTLRMPLERLAQSDFAGLGKLRSLALDDTEVKVLPGDVFATLTNLRFIRLSGNDGLSTLHGNTFRWLTNMEYIQLFGNGITSLPEGAFSGLRRMRYLWLAGNGLHLLPAEVFSDLTSLEQLAIGEDLTTWPPDALSGLSSLEYFWLYGSISRFQPVELPVGMFGGKRGLRFISVQRKLRELPSGLFSGLSGLERLYLDVNQIGELPVGTFAGLANLSRLSLCQNPGTPFPLPLLLKRTDADDLAAPSPATMRVRLATSAPFDMSVPISARGATLSPSVVTVAKGDSTSNTFSVTRRADHSGTVVVSIAKVPEVPTDTCRGGVQIPRTDNTYLGLHVVLGDAVTLFR